MSEEKRSPIEEALAALQSNPELITKIADAIGMESPVQARESPETEQGSPELKSTSTGGKIPDGLLDKLPQVLSALGQSGGSLGGGAGKLNLSALMGDPKKTALLRALCPYLSSARRETAETILRLWSVGDVLKGL